MKLAIIPIIALLGLTACVPATPIVSDFNGSSVKIQVSQMANQAEARANAQAKATRICRQGGKQRAEPASTRTVADYTSELLFLCLG
ncbi:hypothetical protein HOY34_13800 [Xinfangfangia sp. D13-10-4-6]|uniref:hypothetical protein n=1 Tax=Pseudogemmobacter hezensis TaxID=2737662 RepID=UPI001554C7C1|nr:hypothetical protein [Pseudogemmobacter hezensis]NPD16269.1 hypothetical protein [Pseudogemmobacter hezensis]